VEKASEYQAHAKECRGLAAQVISDEHRKQLLAMAETWESFAAERAKMSRSFKAAPGGIATPTEIYPRKR
jgi:hypothetical protein